MEQKNWLLISGSLVIGAVLGYGVRGNMALSPASETKPSTQVTPIAQVKDKPSLGYDLHIDAEKHFAANDNEIAHHYCKQVKGGMFECQLYESDEKDAKLVGVEMVVDTNTWKSFTPSEQALWHYHKEEIPKVNAKLPDLSEEEVAKVVESLTETYGKVYVLWDPAKSDFPTGQPSITILK